MGKEFSRLVQALPSSTRCGPAMPGPRNANSEQYENQKVRYKPARVKATTASKSSILPIGKRKAMRLEAVGTLMRMPDEGTKD